MNPASPAVLSPRAEYLANAVVCLVNGLGFFYAAWGEAARGGDRQWPAMILMAGAPLLLALFSASRAAEVGIPRAIAFIAVLLAVVAGPAVLAVVALLALRPELPAVATRAPPIWRHACWVQPLVLLGLPWLILMLFPDGR